MSPTESSLMGEEAAGTLGSRHSEQAAGLWYGGLRIRTEKGSCRKEQVESRNARGMR